MRLGPVRFPVRYPWLAVVGVLLGAIALLPGTAIEQALGRPPHSYDKGQ
jgi:hypothetical protein